MKVRSRWFTLGMVLCIILCTVETGRYAKAATKKDGPLAQVSTTPGDPQAQGRQNPSTESQMRRPANPDPQRRFTPAQTPERIVDDDLLGPVEPTGDGQSERP